MSSNKIRIKRINKEIEFLYNKEYRIYSNYLNKFFDDIKLDIFTINKVNNINNFLQFTYQENDELHIKIFFKSKLIFDLIIPDDYPFKPYKINQYYFLSEYNNNNINYNNINYNNINYNNINYNKYLHNIGKDLTKYSVNKDILKFFYICKYKYYPKFLILDNKDCFCCSSILCLNNWSPSLRFTDLLYEYTEIEFINYYKKKYTLLYITKIYNYLFEKFPEEIIEHIIEHIYTLN